jgi:hypothetical protein
LGHVFKVARLPVIAVVQHGCDDAIAKDGNLFGLILGLVSAHVFLLLYVSHEVNGSNLRKEILKTVRSYVGNIIYSVNISWQMTDRLEM